MGITCRGICIRYKAIKPRNGTGRYVSGQKRCNSCEIFIHCDGIFCPCCKYRLRMGPRSGKYKEKYLKVMHRRNEVTKRGNKTYDM